MNVERKRFFTSSAEAVGVLVRFFLQIAAPFRVRLWNKGLKSLV